MRRIFGSSSTMRTLGISATAAARQRTRFGHQLREISLRLGDPLDLDRDRFDRLLDAFESVFHVGWYWRHDRRPVDQPSRKSADYRNAKRDHRDRDENGFD